MNEPPLITIGVTAFNDWKYLNEALESVINQTSDKWNGILVLDGGCDTKTKSIFDNFDHHKFRKYNFLENQGPALTRAKAIELCKTDWYYHLDGDDLLPENSLKLILKAINNNPKAQYIFGNCEHFSKNNSIIRRPIKDVEKLCFGPLFNAQTPVKKDFFYDLGGYDLNRIVQIHFDWDFWLTVFENKKIGFQINETIYNRRNRSNNYGNSKIHLGPSSIEYLIKKHQIYFNTAQRINIARFNVYEKLSRYYKSLGNRNLALKWANMALENGKITPGLETVLYESKMSFLRYKLRRFFRYIDSYKK